MLEMFGSIDEFNNLIGEPVNRYRSDYKDLKKLREIFFRRVVGKQVDLDKYLDYYILVLDELTTHVNKGETNLTKFNAMFALKSRKTIGIIFGEDVNAVNMQKEIQKMINKRVAGITKYLGYSTDHINY